MTVATRTLPWTEANEVDAARVARLLSLEPAREKRKYECPLHGGSDSLHAYPDGGFFCFAGCDAISNVDLAAAVLKLEPAESCEYLAESFGLVTRDWNRQTKRRPKPRRKPARAPVDPAPIPDGVRDVWLAVLFLTDLTEAGADYLEGRGLDPDSAKNYGFRSIDSLKEWRDLWRQLAEYFPADRLEASGLSSPPFGGHRPVLVIPYYGTDLRVDALRFRNLSPVATKGDRYRDFSNHGPSVPFHAATALLSLGAGDTLHVTEGEIDAWTLASVHGLHAIGLPGASTPWRPQWSRYLQSVGRLVLWADPDDAGEKAADRIVRPLATAFGRTWASERIRRQMLPSGGDVNELHVRGDLKDVVERGAWND